MNAIFPLRKCDAGAATVEFAIIGPALITMLYGVLQVGIGMRDYNSLRSASADAARHAVINYEVANRLSDEQLSSYAQAIAVRAPYLLTSDRLTAVVTTPATQRIAGMTEKTITLTYRESWSLPFMPPKDVTIRFSRPVFLLQK